MTIDKELWLEFIELAKGLKNCKCIPIGNNTSIGVEVLVNGNEYNKFSIFRSTENGIYQLIVPSLELGGYATVFSVDVPEIKDLFDLFYPKELSLYDDSLIVSHFISKNR